MQVIFKCEFCGQCFQFQANCRVHEQTDHADERRSAERAPPEVHDVSDGEEGESEPVVGDRPVFEVDEEQAEELKRSGHIVLYLDEFGNPMDEGHLEAQPPSEGLGEPEQQPEQQPESEDEIQVLHQRPWPITEPDYIQLSSDSEPEPEETEPEPEPLVFEVSPEEAELLRQAGNMVFVEDEEPEDELLDEEHAEPLTRLASEPLQEHLEEQHQPGIQVAQQEPIHQPLSVLPPHNQLDSRQQSPHLEHLDETGRTKHRKETTEPRRKVLTEVRQQERAESFQYRQENEEPVQQRQIQEMEENRPMSAQQDGLLEEPQESRERSVSECRSVYERNVELENRRDGEHQNATNQHAAEVSSLPPPGLAPSMEMGDLTTTNSSSFHPISPPGVSRQPTRMDSVSIGSPPGLSLPPSGSSSSEPIAPIGSPTSSSWQPTGSATGRKSIPEPIGPPSSKRTAFSSSGSTITSSSGLVGMLSTGPGLTLPSPKLTCHFCGRVYTDEGYFKKHLKGHLEVDMCCVQCGSWFLKQKDLEIHLTSYDKESGKCRKLTATCKIPESVQRVGMEIMAEARMLLAANAPVGDAAVEEEDATENEPYSNTGLPQSMLQMLSKPSNHDPQTMRDLIAACFKKPRVHFREGMGPKKKSKKKRSTKEVVEQPSTSAMDRREEPVERRTLSQVNPPPTSSYTPVDDMWPEPMCQIRLAKVGTNGVQDDSGSLVSPILSETPMRQPESSETVPARVPTASGAMPSATTMSDPPMTHPSSRSPSSTRMDGEESVPSMDQSYSGTSSTMDASSSSQMIAAPVVTAPKRQSKTSVSKANQSAIGEDSSSLSDAPTDAPKRQKKTAARKLKPSEPGMQLSGSSPSAETSQSSTSSLSPMSSSESMPPPLNQPAGAKVKLAPKRPRVKQPRTDDTRTKAVHAMRETGCNQSQADPLSSQSSDTPATSTISPLMVRNKLAAALETYRKTSAKKPRLSDELMEKQRELENTLETMESDSPTTVTPAVSTTTESSMSPTTTGSSGSESSMADTEQTTDTESAGSSTSPSSAASMMRRMTITPVKETMSSATTAPDVDQTYEITAVALSGDTTTPSHSNEPTSSTHQLDTSSAVVLAPNTSPVQDQPTTLVPFTATPGHQMPISSTTAALLKMMSTSSIGNYQSSCSTPLVSFPTMFPIPSFSARTPSMAPFPPNASTSSNPFPPPPPPLPIMSRPSSSFFPGMGSSQLMMPFPPPPGAAAPSGYPFPYFPSAFPAPSPQPPPPPQPLFPVVAPPPPTPHSTGITPSAEDILMILTCQPTNVNPENGRAHMEVPPSVMEFLRQRYHGP